MDKKEFQGLTQKEKRDYLKALLEAKKEESRNPVIKPDPDRKYEKFPLSDIQEAYLVGKNLGGAESQNGCHIYYEFEELHLDIPRLEQAWNKLAAHHDMLRDRIHPKGTQRIEKPGEWYHIKVYDVSGEDAETGFNKRRQVRERLSHKLYLAGDYPLYEIVVTTVAGGISIVHFSMDEWIIDAASISRLFEQWYCLYLDLDYPLKEAGLSFRDYVLAQKKFEEEKKFKEDLLYWKSAFEGIDGKPFSIIRQEDEVKYKRNRTRRYLYRLPKEKWSRIKNRSVEKGVSPTSYILAAFLNVLNVVAEEENYPVILTYGDRMGQNREIQEIIGPFITTLYYLEKNKRQTTADEKARQVQETLWEMDDHRSVSGVRILRELKREKKLESGYQVPVVFTSMISSVKDTSGASGSWYEKVTYGITQTPQVFLDHQVLEEDGCLTVHWDVQEERFFKGMIPDLFYRYTEELEELACMAQLRIDKRPEEVRFGLTPLQQSYWFLQKGRGATEWEGMLYQEFDVISDSAERISAAWDDIVAETAMLHSVFTSDGMQKIEKNVQKNTVIYDLSGLLESEQAACAEEIRGEMIQKKFSLFQGPRCALSILKTGRDRLRILLASDPSVADGQSLCVLYRRLFDPQSHGLKEQVSFGGYLYAYGQYVKTNNTDHMAQFWREKTHHLAAGPFIGRIRERHTAPDLCRNMQRASVLLPQSENIIQYAIDHGIKIDSILSSFYLHLLSEWDDNPSFTVVCVTWDRPVTEPSISCTIGDFTTVDWLVFPDRERELKDTILDIDEQMKAAARNSLVMSLPVFAKQNRELLLPVAFTGLVKAKESVLPSNVTLGYGVSNTPGVYLDMICVREHERIRVNWDYDESIFSKEEIDEKLTEYIDKINRFLNPVEVPFAAESIHGNVELQAKLRPDRTAVRMGGQELNYCEINQSANRLAHFMCQRGVVPGDFVGICLEKSPDMIVAILAVLKAGGAYIPMDPAYPADRIIYMQKDSGPKAVITNSICKEKLDETISLMISLDDCNALIQQQQSDDLLLSAGRDSTAYIIYTSGSTGKPKGVMVTHRNVVRLFQQTERWFHFDENDVWTMFHSFSFDFSVWEIWGALFAGGTLVIVPYEISRSYRTFYKLLEQEKVTVLNQTPTAFYQLIDAEEEIGTGELCLRYVIFGGEALHFPKLKPWFLRHGDKKPQLINMYGITETTVHVTYRRITEADTGQKMSLIGECIPDLKLYLLDDRHKKVLPGEEGELCISGPGLAKGYLNRPDITKEKFIQNPFEPDERLYLSGDLGRLAENGEIEYIGRKDTQVKVRGFRIELGEIERVLEGHPNISQAAVILDRKGKEPKLKAFVVTDRPMVSKVELRKFVRNKLPDYMVPNVMVEVHEIPLTVNGKLDQNKLMFSEELGKEEALKGNQLKMTGHADEKKIRDTIHKIFLEELECNALEYEEDIFNLGGTSLTIVNISRRFSEELNVEVPLDIFLEDPIIKHIEDYILAKMERSDINPSEMDQNDKKTWDKVKKSTFSSLLGLLKKEMVQGKTRYLYPSAGGKNAVQTYVYVKKDGVEGIEEGVYYYHPEEHALCFLSGGGAITASVYPQFYQNLYEKSAFAIYFIAQLKAIEPVYLDFSEGLVTVDSGYMKQLLLNSEEAKEMGLVGIDAIDFDRIKGEFLLEATHICLSGMLGGSRCTENELDFPEGWQGADLLTHYNRLPDFLTKEKQEELIRSMKYNQLTKREILELAKKKLHIRKFSKDIRKISLEAVAYDKERFIARSSKRNYEEKKVDISKLKGILSKLSQAEDGSCPYSSVGNEYLVEVYVYLKKGAVAGWQEGIYFFNQAEGELEPVRIPFPETMEYCHTPFNRPHYKQSKFGIYFVADVSRARDLYNAAYLKYVLCEAGGMGQILMDSQAQFGIGLVPIGGMNFDKVRTAFGLNDNYMLLHSFMGGCFDYRNAVEPCQEKIPSCEKAGRANAAQGDEDEIAVIGISGKFPMADSVCEYWSNLREGRDCIKPVPPERWKDPFHDVYGGFIDKIDEFDPRYFQIAPEEAAYLDPQVRIFLAAVNDAFFDAGYQFTENKEERNIGVFVGAMYQQYYMLAPQDENADIMAIQSYSAIANRVSYFFNFTGPSIAVDTACSSAIAALSMACDSLKAGQCEACVAGGINLTLHPSKYGALRKMGLLSKKHETRCFGEGDGFLPGEGAGALILKKKEAAIRDKNHIYGIIKGIKVRHTGKTNAYSMPSVSMEQALIQETLEASKVTIQDIDYVECSANGTPLGDAAEYNALKNVFLDYENGMLPIGSVKSNIGHLEAASGLAQMIKVLLQFQFREIVPTIHVTGLNPMISQADSKLSIVTERSSWKGTEGHPLTALVNTFAAGGTNACTVFSAYEDSETIVCDKDCYVMLLSAGSKDELLSAASALGSFLDRNLDIDMKELEYTLGIFQDYLSARAVLLCKNREDLAAKLDLLQHGKEHEDIFLGTVTENPGIYRLFREEKEGMEIVRKWTADQNFRALSELWVHGTDIDWRSHCFQPSDKKVPLYYPFYHNKRLWVSGALEQKPQNETEEPSDVRKILCDIMKMDPSGIHFDDHLQNIGFNSIYALKMIAKLKESCGIELTLRDLMQAGSIKDLNDRVQEKINMHKEYVQDRRED